MIGVEHHDFMVASIRIITVMPDIEYYLLTVRVKIVVSVLRGNPNLFWMVEIVRYGTYPVLCAYSIFCQKIRLFRILAKIFIIFS